MSVSHLISVDDCTQQPLHDRGICLVQPPNICPRWPAWRCLKNDACRALLYQAIKQMRCQGRAGQLLLACRKLFRPRCRVGTGFLSHPFWPGQFFMSDPKFDPVWG